MPIETSHVNIFNMELIEAAKFLSSAGSFAHVSSKSGKNTSSIVRRRFVNPSFQQAAVAWKLLTEDGVGVRHGATGDTARARAEAIRQALFVLVE
jgi:hypothetical protein